MKKWLPALMIFVSAAAFAASAPAPKEVTSTDWLLMSRPEKVELVQKLVKDLGDHGIPLSISPVRYASDLDVVADDPKVKKGTTVRTMLVSIAYLKEPRVRAIMDLRKKELQKRDEKAKKEPRQEISLVDDALPGSK